MKLFMLKVYEIERNLITETKRKTKTKTKRKRKKKTRKRRRQETDKVLKKVKRVKTSETSKNRSHSSVRFPLFEPVPPNPGIQQEAAAD